MVANVAPPPLIDETSPNKLTAETLAKSEWGEDLHHFDSAEALFEDLDI